MATVVNARDLKLASVTPRFNTLRSKGIYLSSDSQSFVVKGNNTVLPSSGITLTAEYVGITPATGTSPVFTVAPVGSATLTAIDSMRKKLEFGNMLQDEVTVTATITDSAGVVYTSSTAVRKLREPDIGVDISLDTNVFKVVSGVATPGNIKVTVSTKYLEFIGSPSFTLTAVDASDATIVGITLVPDVVLPNVWLLDYDDLVTAGVSSVWVKVSVTDKYSITHTNKAAVTTVSYAQYVTVTGEQTFKFLSGSSTPTSSSITLTALLTGGLTTYDWEYWNGSSWVNLSGTQNTSTYALAYNNAAWSGTTLRVRCLSGAVYDETTVVKLYDGSSAVVGYLTNETIALSSASNGTGYNLSNASGTFKVFSGTTDVSSSSSFSVVSTATLNGLTATIGSTGYYSTSGASWTSDSESYILRATYAGINIDKTFTVSKAKAGAAGEYRDIIQLYLQAGTTPTKPSSVLYTFTGNTLGTVTGGTAGWSLTQPASTTTPTYLTTCPASTTTPGTAITLTAWTTPVVIAQSGTNGINGNSVYVATIYKQSATDPGSPVATASTYNFATNTLTAPAGWSVTQPATTTTPTWACNYTFSGTAGSTVTGTGSWSTTRIEAVNGSNGNNGEYRDIIQLYLQSATVPTKPTSVVYTFTGNVLGTITGGTAGWSLTQPASTTTPTYLITCPASTTTPGTAVTLTAWTTPVVIAQSGTNGANGRTYALAITDGTRSFVYNAAGTASSPTTSAAYGMSLTLDGSVVTPSSYTWSATGRLYVDGTVITNTSTFTPKVNQTYSGDNTSVTLSVTHGSPAVTTSLTVPIGIGKVGDTGTPGTKSVVVKLFKWDTSATIPTTDSSFNWSTMALSLGSVTVWGTSVTSPTVNGQKLYELSKVITVAATYTGTTTVDWNTADTAGPVGVINEIGIRADGSIGPTGPRTATGYVYYTLESASVPTTPTASAFDFSTGAFTSLTANWSTSFNIPSASSSTTGEKYWSSRFVVSEATYGGSQTITFATAVTSTNFDGLVTFTNLSTGTNGAGTTTTFIDGGAITASSVTAGKISTASLSAIQANLGAVTIATAGNVKSGKTTANDTTNAGFFLGYDSPTYTFFIGNAGDTTSLKYDGNLTLKGGVMNVGTTGAVYGGQTDYDVGKGFFLGYSSGINKVSVGNQSFTVTANPSTDNFTSTSFCALYPNTSVVYISNLGSTTGLKAGRWYFVINNNGTTFQLSETSGGAAKAFAGSSSSVTIGGPSLKFDGTNLNFTGSALTSGYISTSTNYAGPRVDIDGSNSKLVLWKENIAETTLSDAIRIGAGNGLRVSTWDAITASDGLSILSNSSSVNYAGAMLKITNDYNGAESTYTDSINLTTNTARAIKTVSSYVGSTAAVSFSNTGSGTTTKVTTSSTGVALDVSNTGTTGTASALNVTNSALGTGISIINSNVSNTNPAITATVAGSNPAIEVIGGGIKFPSTAVASSNANTLDDYKEATWTPTVVGTSTGIAVGSASYTKIGRAINFTLNLTFTATGTGVVTFTLPQATTTNFTFSCFAAGTVASMPGPVSAWVDSGTSTVNINYFNLSTGAMGSNDMGTKVKSGTDIRVSGTYW